MSNNFDDHPKNPSFTGINLKHLYALETRQSTYMHDIDLPLFVVRSLTFITLQPQKCYDGAHTGQMCNPPALHSSEGQKNEKPGSVVSHCWPWLQVIKALLSFCQSSDSPNISPWLISAVSSVRALYQTLKGSTRSLCVHCVLEHSLPLKAKLDLHWYLFGLSYSYHLK